MTSEQVVKVLAEHGFQTGRMITRSKTGYYKRHPDHFVVFNAQVFNRRERLLGHVDLDLSLDAERLTAAARAIGENLFVLEEMEPHPHHEPGELPMAQVLRHTIWWTRTRPEDEDIFVPVDSRLWRPTRQRLACTTWTWQGRPAYGINVWNNPEWHNSNMVGAAVELWGSPPKSLRPEAEQQEGEHFTVKIAASRGRPVRPVFYQRSGPIEYVWFSHRVAFPAVFFDHSVRLLASVTYTHHTGHNAIHVRRDGELIGLIWPCGISAPEVIGNARLQFQRLRRERVTGQTQAQSALTAAVARGAVVKQKLADDEGGSVSSAQAARLLGISRASVFHRYRDHRMVGWSEDKTVRFPVWQFAGSKMLQGIVEVLQIFDSDDQWRVMRYFLGKRHSFADRRPLDLLREGKVAEVIAHAKAFAADNTW